MSDLGLDGLDDVAADLKEDVGKALDVMGVVGLDLDALFAAAAEGRAEGAKSYRQAWLFRDNVGEGQDEARDGVNYAVFIAEQIQRDEALGVAGGANAYQYAVLAAAYFALAREALAGVDHAVRLALGRPLGQ